MSKASRMKVLGTTAVMTLAMGLPASADQIRAGHGARAHAGSHRHVARLSRRPVPVAVSGAGPRYPYVDDGSRYDTEFDGIAIGREGDLVPRDGSGPRYVRQGGSFELSGPPISPSLPVVPELIDPSLY